MAGLNHAGGPWTHFWDMHSGGGTKEPPYEDIFIEAPEDEATVVFYNRFGHSPSRISCTCCGDDYSISESETLEQATGYHRGLRQIDKTGERSRYLEPGEPVPDGWTLYERSWASDSGEGITLDEYREHGDVLIIPASEIQPSEREGVVPEE